jgi:hypothetical protein
MQRMLSIARAMTSDPVRGASTGFRWKLGFQLTGEKGEGHTVGVLDLTNS